MPYLRTPSLHNFVEHGYNMITTFADKAVMESLYIAQKLSELMYYELKLLKDNSWVLRIENECAVLKRSTENKFDLDLW